jgi:hypothetical protein
MKICRFSMNGSDMNVISDNDFYNLYAIFNFVYLNSALNLRNSNKK